jgi:hypothetical protein
MLRHPAPFFARRAPAAVRLILALAAAGTAGAMETAADPAFAQRVYVWQRSWSPALRQALAETAPAFSAFDVLAAEISWPAATAVTARLAPDWSALPAGHRPVGVVVRVGPYRGPWAAGSASTRAVVEASRAALADARQHGIEPGELQLDFDAPTARLGTYQELVRIVRAEIRPPRLVITALPDWLRSPDFAALVAATDCYVLQVHSLEKPGRIDDAFTLCDPGLTAGWIERAARLGHPFRIALPAYGYRLVFDAAGRFAALEAEGPARRWPEGYTTRLAVADPAELADLVQQLLATPPAACEGIEWFRFPTEDDELAWSWPTLRAVMQGHRPRAQLTLVAAARPDGNIDLSETNQGSASAAPAAMRVEWHGARLIAADGIAGWRLERRGPAALIVRPPAAGSNGLLRPGAAVTVGWLRLDGPASLSFSSAD